MNRTSRGLIGLATLAIAQPLFAQEAANNPDQQQSEKAATRRFTLADFAQYNPVNALDIVQRIPGFSIEGSDGRRGFGDNAGNVLIDGDRPSTKSEDIFTILSRIPADQVEYVELTEAAGADGEARGKSQIVNVVRKKSNKISGTYEVNLRIGEKHDATPSGNASASIRRGNTTYQINAGLYAENVRSNGPEDFLTPTRALRERRTYSGRGLFKNYNLSGAISTKFGSAKLNLNGKLVVRDWYDNRLGVITGPTGNPVGLETLISGGKRGNIGYELGGDFEFRLAPKLTTKVVGLWGDDPHKELVTVDTLFYSEPSALFAADMDARQNEGIFRIQNDWTGIKDHAIQFGGEVAFNRLNSRLLQSGTSIVVPPSQVTVREWRAEPFVSDVWTISPALKLEAGLVFEASTLRVTGDSRAKRSLSYWKPRLIATWTVNKRTTLEFRVEREVAQLDFDEFATAVDVSNGNQVDAGNAELVPERATNFSALVRHKFLSRGSVQLKGEYQRVDDTQDLVPITLRDAAGNITARFDGAGNIGRSRRLNIELEITLPFDWLTKSLEGLELKYVGHYHDSRVTDPVTGLGRLRSNRPYWHQNWDLRHDVKNTGFAWGVSAFRSAPVRQFFLNQIRSTNNDVQLTFFLEYKKLKWGTLRFSMDNVFGPRQSRRRVFFRDTRATGEVVSLIERQRYFDRGFTITLSGKF